jgi:molybdopterin converting factor small subunit
MGGNGVTIGKVGIKKKHLDAVEGDTVRVALDRAQVSADGHEVRIRGNRVGLDYKIQDGDELILVPNIEGARQ